MFLLKLSLRRISEIWCELNMRKMPRELKGRTHLIDKDRRILMLFIEILIGKDECLNRWREKRRRGNGHK